MLTMTENVLRKIIPDISIIFQVIVKHWILKLNLKIFISGNNNNTR